MGLDKLSGAQLYMHNKRQCDDSFPQKKMHFCFNHLRIPVMGSRSQKVGGLKYFEVHSIQEKESDIHI
jgi:hypothetical protein